MTTWPCGTPKYRGNAFDLNYAPGRTTPVKPKHKAIRRTKAQRSAIALETPAERSIRQMLERASRVNACVDLGAHGRQTNSEKAPR